MIVDLQPRGPPSLFILGPYSKSPRSGGSTHSASVQLRSFPSYTPPAINFSRIIDQRSIFNWSQGAPYMLNGINCIHFPPSCGLHQNFSMSLLFTFVSTILLIHVFNDSLGQLSYTDFVTGLDTFVPWEMVAPVEYCPEAVSNCTQPPCPPPKCIAIYAVIPQVKPVQVQHFNHNIPCVNVSWYVSRNSCSWQSAYHSRILFNRYIRDSSGSILRKFFDTEVCF
jgi:hypothetical protein